MLADRDISQALLEAAQDDTQSAAASPSSRQRSPSQAASPKEVQREVFGNPSKYFRNGRLKPSLRSLRRKFEQARRDQRRADDSSSDGAYHCVTSTTFYLFVVVVHALVGDTSAPSHLFETVPVTFVCFVCFCFVPLLPLRILVYWCCPCR